MPLNPEVEPAILNAAAVEVPIAAEHVLSGAPGLAARRTVLAVFGRRRGGVGRGEGGVERSNLLRLLPQPCRFASAPPSSAIAPVPQTSRSLNSGLESPD